VVEGKIQVRAGVDNFMSYPAAHFLSLIET